ncbi:MAG: TRAP transporter TatT component family protein [Planctomycetota bacterium]
MSARTTPGAVAVLGLLVAAASGCSIQEMAVDQMVPVLEKTRDDFNRGTVVENARQAGPALVAFLNGLAEGSPQNPQLRLLQAELNFSYAFAFLEESNPAWATESYQKAQAAALIALAQEDDDLAAELPKLPLAALRARLDEDADENALPALFWWAFTRGAEINLHRGDAARVTDLPRVDVVMEWVVAHDPTFFNAGPHLFLGMRYLALPPSLGGKPEKGLEHFKRVEELTKHKNLLVRVLQAQFYAPTLAATPAGAKIDEVLAAQKRAWEAYYGGLVAVLDAPDDLWPENAIYNALAKERAKKLLADPEGNNIIPPPGVKNPYAKGGGDAGGEWGGDAPTKDGKSAKGGDDEGWGD